MQGDEEDKKPIVQEADPPVEEEKKKKKKKKNKNKQNQEEDGQEPKEEEEKKVTAHEDEEEKKVVEGEGEDGEAQKKKKKKKKKKGGGGEKDPLAGVEFPPREQDNSFIRNLGNWSADGPWKQTIDYTIPIISQYPDHKYPAGQILDHPCDFNMFRTTSEECRARDQLTYDKVNDLRMAAECHRQVRKSAQTLMRPGIKLIDLCQHIEETNRRLIIANGIERGIAFPTGCSINHCAAHWTPNPGDDTVLGKDDVMKIDFGTQVNGNIIDCAFTVSFNPTFDNLLIAVKEATDEGLKQAGVGVRLCDIGEAIQEVMESHEVTIGNTTYPVKAVQNLCGHSIGPWQIHAGNSVPIVKGGVQTKMAEGELYAIETFGSTGKGTVFEAPDCSHYMRDFENDSVALRNPKAKALLAHINNHFGSLAFCRRWIEDAFPRHVAVLRDLVNSGIVKPYPPLNDVAGSHVAQYEHTIYLGAQRKEILSRGQDY